MATSQSFDNISIAPPVIPQADRLLLDTKAAAQMLSISEGTLEKLPIPRVRIPGTRVVRWRLVDLEEFVRGLAA